MSEPRLEVRDVLGERVVTIDRTPFTIGRRETNSLRLGGSEVSREHAEIAHEDGRYLLRDKDSRYGTFVNGDPVKERELQSGDRVRLGRGGGADLTFLAADDERNLSSGRSTTGARDDLRQINALLEGFRARIGPRAARGARARARCGHRALERRARVHHARDAGQ